MPETISYIDINSQTYEIKDSEARTALTGKQDTLVSGTNLKTVNNQSLLGSGNIDTYIADENKLNIDGSNADQNYFTIDSRNFGVNADNEIGLKGDTIYLDGNIIVGTGYTIEVEYDPSEDQHLTNKHYVDSLFATSPIGKVESGTGIYAPSTITPGQVGNGSLLITEGSGTTLGPKSIAVSTGKNMTCRSAAAGSTIYRFANTYANRIFAATVAIAGAVAALSEAAAKEGLYANVLSVQVNNSNFTVPDSSATSSDDIVITLDKTINPNSATTTVRFYPSEGGFSTVHAGQGIGSKDGNGGSVLVGQGVGSNGGNACALVGADLFNTGNGNAVFGRQHISRKNRWFMAGTGHDNTDGKLESGAVFGEFADIKSDTAFAIGNGTSQTARSNLFEIKTNGDIYKNGVKIL